MEDNLDLAMQLMRDFAWRTGLDPVSSTPTRYLWTDAFAVCVYLDLYHRTKEEHYLTMARRLVDQVHHVLGKHRPDDSRSGWLSGLSETEGEERPTAGGLRIGKKLPERQRDDFPDPMLEWEQDGQYYHYLTKWMHALERMAVATGEACFQRWGMELAHAIQSRFTHTAPHGQKQMYWKMSIDLSYPLVTSMGQHDAVDGLVTYLELQEGTRRFINESFPDLEAEIKDVKAMACSDHWITDDPLGAGSLLTDAWKLMQIKSPIKDKVLPKVLRASRVSLDHVSVFMRMQGQAEDRLAFRELGLSIGLHAVEEMQRMVENEGVVDGVKEAVTDLARHKALAQRIEDFWAKPSNRSAQTWKDHEDINAVMLAASLSPGDFLTI
jgi:hypothetical protein